MPIATVVVAFSLKMQRHSAESWRSESTRRGGAPSYANSRMVGRTALVETLKIYKALQILQLGLLARQRRNHPALASALSQLARTQEAPLHVTMSQLLGAPASDPERDTDSRSGDPIQSNPCSGPATARD